MDKIEPKPSANSWPFFLAAAFIFLGTPYPNLSSNLIPSINGTFLIAKIGLFIITLSVAVWVKQGAVAAGPATRMILAAYFGIYALFSPLSLALVRLLPLMVLAWVHWRGMPALSNSNPITKFPPWAREALAFVLALLGCSSISISLNLDNDWKFEQINYILLWLGFNFCMLSGLLVLTAGTKRNVTSALLSGYGITLALVCLINTFSLVRDPSPANLLAQTGFIATCAMMLFQVWRHFKRENALLKVGETFLGGIFFLSGFQLAYSVIQEYGAWFILTFVIVIPLVILGGLLSVLGLKMMWSDDIQFERIIAKWRR
jgi:hypothetical protein